MSRVNSVKCGFVKRFFAAVVCLAVCCGLFAPKAYAAGETIVDVNNASDINTALAGAGEGDSYKFIIHKKIYTGDDNKRIVIPAGVTATITNAKGVDAVIMRYPLNADATSVIETNGTLIIEEDPAGGSLTFDGADVDFKFDPILVVAGTGSSLTINSGTITGNASYYGAMYSCDGANTTINGGTFSSNTNMSKDGLGQGGFVYAANSDLLINGGLFKGNKSRLMGGAIYYEGRGEDKKLTVNGGVFDGNESNSEMFGGAAIYIACQNEKFSYAAFNGGRFENNVASGLGGAVYIQDGAGVTMQNIVVYGNTAISEGGGIWNCPTGGSNGYNFNGLYIAENKAGTAGDDILSKEKEREGVYVNVSDYSFDGKRCNWTIDESTNRNSGIKPDGSYYQATNKYFAIKSGLAAANAPAGQVVFINNAGRSGGAIANNGIMNIGTETCLSAAKTTTVGTDKEFSFVVTLERDDLPVEGNFVARDGDGVYSSVAFGNDGKATVKLKNGEKFCFIDVPMGASFGIEELPETDWTLQSSTNTLGKVTIEDNNGAFVNAPFVPSPKTGEISLAALVGLLSVCIVNGVVLAAYRRKSSVR